MSTTVERTAEFARVEVELGADARRSAVVTCHYAFHRYGHLEELGFIRSEANL